MQRNAMLFSGGLLVLALIGGGVAMTQLDQCSGTQCTLEARPSVVVKVVDKAGEPVSADSVFYSRIQDPAVAEPRNMRRAECIDEECTEWVAAREEPGIFTVHATACGGTSYESGIVVGMTDDDCHVDTQTIELAIDECPNPSNTVQPGPNFSCGPVKRPAVQVEIWFGEGDEAMRAPADAVWYSRIDNTKDKNLQPEPPAIDPTDEDAINRNMATCNNDECSVWLAGYDDPGYYTVYALTCGTVVEGSVDVPMGDDGCGPQTQRLLLQADRTGCVNKG